jgi:hypothetical protein
MKILIICFYFSRYKWLEITFYVAIGVLPSIVVIDMVFFIKI